MLKKIRNSINRSECLDGFFIHYINRKRIYNVLGKLNNLWLILFIAVTGLMFLLMSFFQIHETFPDFYNNLLEIAALIMLIFLLSTFNLFALDSLFPTGSFYDRENVKKRIAESLEEFYGDKYKDRIYEALNSMTDLELLHDLGIVEGGNKGIITLGVELKSMIKISEG